MRLQAEEDIVMMVNAIYEVAVWVLEAVWVWVWECEVCELVACDALVNEELPYGEPEYGVMVYGESGCEVLAYGMYEWWVWVWRKM